MDIFYYVLVGVLIVFLVYSLFAMNRRNKKENQRMQEQTNSLKVGDKVMTTSGVYGTITELLFDDTKQSVVIETGGKIKSYITIDAYMIYTVFKTDEELAKEAEEKARLEEEKKQKEEQEKAEKEAKKEAKKQKDKEDKE